MERRTFLMLTLAGAATLARSHISSAANSYSTNFVNPENPISENGHWINGKSVGLDWQDVTTTPGFATFTQPNPSTYDDATAILTGTWGSNQYVRTTVRIPTVDPSFAQEIEIRLRSSLSPPECSGYDVLGGSQIVRWNGALGDFTVLNTSGPGGQLHDGDIFEASMVGNVITVLINGVQVSQATDNTFTGGSPGIGFFTRNPSAAKFGFSSFMASDSPLRNTAPPAPPTNVSIR